MPTYKIYGLTSAGHLKEPPLVITCHDDSDAIFAASAHQEADKEIRQQDRRVAVLNAHEADRMAAMASDIHATVVMTRDIIDNSRECLREADRSLMRR